jgi:hypothetical protein
MSFIVGLSTMATVIVPFAAAGAELAAPAAVVADPAAGALVALDFDVLLPHALATTPTTTTAVTHAARRVDLRTPRIIASPFR